MVLIGKNVLIVGMSLFVALVVAQCVLPRPGPLDLCSYSCSVEVVCINVAFKF